MTGIQVIPPPCFIASSFGQVSDPGSPFFCGTVYQRHCISPLSGSWASRYPGIVQVVAADPGDDLVLDHDRRRRGVIELVHVADLLVPLLLAALHVERDEMAVRRLEVERVAERRHAAVAEWLPPFDVPRRSARSRGRCGPRRPRRDRGREVQDAVDHQRRRLDRPAGGDGGTSSQAQRLDVRVGDLLSGLKRRPE